MQPVCENKENEARGCLSVNDKVYPVYDGHNTVGRNPEATVNLKRLNVSKTHAVITVFDRNLHYLSDFKSSNGTFLNGKKLTPLRLYQLENGASIRFGDVFCTYRKLGVGTSIGRSLDVTQDCCETFYATGTQEIALQEHEFGVNYNELPTQVFATKEMSFNEMATQVHDLVPQEDSSNDSIDFLTMQKASETQHVNLDQQNGVSSKNRANQDTLSQIIPVALNTRKILDSDDESTPEKKVEGSDTEEYEIPEVTKSKYNISDDSETDIDDDEEVPRSHNESSMKSLRLTESPKISQGHSDQKIEETENVISKVEIVEHSLQKIDFVVPEKDETMVPRTDEESMTPIESNETELEKTEISHKEKIDDLFLQPTQSLDIFEENKDKSCEEIFLRATQVLSVETKEEKQKETAKVQETISEVSAKKANEDGATPELEENPGQDPSIQESPSNLDSFIGDEAAEIQQHLPLEESEKKSAGTPDNGNQDVSVELSKKTQENDRNSEGISDFYSFLHDEAAKKTNEDLERLLSEQQNDKPENSDENTPEIVVLAESSRKKSQNIEDKPQAEENLEPLFSEDKNVENTPSITEKTQEIEEKLQIDEELEDTPNLDPLLSEPQKTNTILSDDDDDFFPPTQHAEPSTSKSLFFKPFKVPSPVAQKKKPVEDDDSFILQPTQALEVLHDDGTHFARVEDELHEIFASQSMLCTQQLVDVLDTTVGEIVDDSIQEESIVGFSRSRKSEVLTTDSVKKILEESGEEETPKKTSSREEEENDTPKVEEKKKGRKINQRLTVLEENDNKKAVSDISNSRRSTRKSRSEESSERPESSTCKAEAANKKGKKKGDGKSESEDSQSSRGSEKPGRKTKGKKEEESHTNTDGSEISETPKEKDQKQKAEKEVAGTFKIAQKRKGKIEDDTQRSDGDEPVAKRKTRKKSDEQKSDKEDSQSSKVTTRTGRRGRSKVEEVVDPENSEKSEKGDSQSSRSSERIGQRGRAKTVDEPFSKKNGDNDKNQESEEQSVKNDSQNSRVSKRIEQRGRGKTKEESESTNIASKNKSEEEKDESTIQPVKSDSQSYNISERVGRRRSGRAVDEPETSSETSNKKGKKKKVDDNKKESSEKDDSQSSTVSERTVRRGRSKTIEPQSGSVDQDKTKTKKKESQEKKSNELDSQVSGRGLRGKKPTEKETNEIKTEKRKSTQEEEKAADPPPSRRTSKRKQEENEEPTKQTEKVPSPMRRPIRLASNNSEDDFITKVPKIDTSPTKLRKSSRKTKNDDDVSVASDDSCSSPKKRRLSANSRQQKRESSVLPTPERTRRQLKPKVVFTMMNNPELESVVRQLGGTVVDTVESCTVLVTEQVKRTQKLLCAVAQGKPICSPEWLLACKKTFSFLDPWDHLLVDKEAEKKWKFSLKTSLERGSRSKLLENHTFQVIVDVGADVLKGAIEACGGKCVTRNLPKSESEHLLIVSSEKNKSKCDKIAKQNKKIKVVEAEAIFDGTLRQEFKFNQFLLS